eukprot:jgi/Astpho2/8491/Aster-05533
MPRPAANERTFLHWLNMSVTVGSISAALIGIAGHVHKYGQQEYEARAIFVHSVALVMLTVSIGMAVYATFNFRQRMSWLANRVDAKYDDRILPVVLSIIMMVALSIVFGGSLLNIISPSST